MRSAEVLPALDMYLPVPHTDNTAHGLKSLPPVENMPLLQAAHLISAIKLKLLITPWLGWHGVHGRQGLPSLVLE
jgi:hypothetical protein